MAAEKKNVATILRTFSLKIYVHCRMSRRSVANQSLTFRFFRQTEKTKFYEVVTDEN